MPQRPQIIGETQLSFRRVWVDVERPAIFRFRGRPIEIRQSGDIVEAKLADGKQAYLKLQREPGIDGKGVVLKNVKYFNAVQNDGFRCINRSSISPTCKDISFPIPIGTRS